LRKQKDFSFLESVPTWISVKKCKSWSVASLIIRGVGVKKTSTFTARWSVPT
jgi:hypothetical protein